MSEQAFDIVLIAPSGREQAALFKVSRDGVVLATADRELNRFPFEVIKKWLPSNMRSKNPGDADSLDLQIMTDKGARDLRMRCAGAGEVQHIIHELRTTVEEVLQHASPDHTPMASQSRQGITVGFQGYAPSQVKVQQQQQDVNMQHAATMPQLQPQQQQQQMSMGTIPVQFVSSSMQGGHGILAPQAAAMEQLWQQQQQQQQHHHQAAFPQQQHLESTRHVASFSNQYANQGFYPPAYQQQQPGSTAQAPAAMLQAQTQAAPEAAAQAAEAAAAAAQPAEPGALTQGTYAQMHEMEGEMHELQQQNEFLEGLVKRLATEVAHWQAKAGEHPNLDLQDDPQIMALTLGMAGDMVRDAPLPPWLQDRRFLNPLLSSYDDRVASLEAQLSARAEGLERLQRQVEEVVGENDRLRVELQQQREEAARQLQAASSSAGPQEQVSLLLEENALLRHENDLLVSQQNGLEGELQRLHQALEERALEAVAAAQESAAAAARCHQVQAAAAQAQEEAEALVDRVQTEAQALVRGMQAEVQAAAAKAQKGMQAVAAKLSKTQAALRAAEQRISALEAENQGLGVGLEDEKSSAGAARRALDDLRQHHAAQQAELATLQAHSREAREGQAALQVELSSLRERYDEAIAEVTASHREVEQLRSALTSREARLAEYQKSEAQVHARMKDALEEAEQARLARDTATTSQRELRQEVEVLRDRLATVQRAVRDQVYGELQGKLHEAAEKLRQQEEEADAAEKQVSELKAQNERLQRELRSLASELSSLKADLGESSKARVSLVSLSAMEKIQELERSRDEAAQKLESTERKLERATRDWQLQKQALEIEVRDLRGRAAEAEGLALSRRNEVVGLSRQVEALGRELQAAAISRARLEEETRLQASAVRAERDQEVRALAAKLESTLASCNRSMAEADRMLEAKEVLLARWKEEAQLIATKLDRALADHKWELDEQRAAAAMLMQQCEALQQDSSQLAADLGEARAAAAQLHAALEEAEARGARLGMQLLAAQAAEEEQAEEVRALQAMLERARLAASARQGGGHGVKDSLMSKYDAFKRTAAVVAVASDVAA